MARSDILPGDQEISLTLDRYQEMFADKIPIAAFNGLTKEDDDDCAECNYPWKQTDLDALAQAIARAEEMRERELGYFLAPKYVEDEEYDYLFPLILKKKHLISVGSPAVSTIQLGVTLDHGVETNPNDPVEITVATSVTSIDEICVYYPGEDVKITPSSVTISGGNATIEIPRSRLVKPTVDLNCDPSPSYYENDNFLETVDVKRCYEDSCDGAFLTWFGGDCYYNCPQTFETTSQAAYAKIEDRRLSILKLFPGTCSGGAWSPSCVVNRRNPDGISISYKSGIRSSSYTEQLTAGLAHTVLYDIIPDRRDLCASCWQQDQEKDESELVTPYGDTRGAIKAWLADSRAKIGYGTTTGGINNQ